MKIKLGNIVVWASIMGMVQLVSCRKSEVDSSGGKSLDTLAGNVDVDSLEQCTGTFKDNRGIVNLLAGHHDKLTVQSKHESTQMALKQEVASILESAIPTPLVGSFLANNGKIIVSPQADEWCAKADEERRLYPNLSEYELAFAKANQEKILGCWSKGVEEFASSYNIVIHMDQAEADSAGDPVKSKKIIRNTLVRLFGYVSGQLLSQIDYNTDDQAIVDGIDTVDFGKFKADLADAFVGDVSKSMQADPASGDNLSGKALWAEILKSEEKDPIKAWTAVKSDQSKSKLKEAFEDFVFAEAFDSRLCTDATRKSMEEGERFSGTGAVFIPVADLFEKMDKELQEGATDADIEAATAIVAGSAGNAANLVQMRFFRRIFGGLYRVARAVFRGVVRVAGWVVRGAVRIIRGAVRVVAAAVRVVAHAAAHVVRFVGRVGWVVARGVVNGVAAVHNWIWQGGRYRGYYFKPQYNVAATSKGTKLLETGLSAKDTKEVGIIAVPTSHEPYGDWDHDGVPNNKDQCANTGRVTDEWVKWGEKPSDAIKAQKGADYKYIIVDGPYAGCAKGQFLDYYHYRQTSDYNGNYYQTEGDLDNDGVADAIDRCSNTPEMRKVWAADTKDANGMNFIGCSGGQMVDR